MKIMKRKEYAIIAMLLLAGTSYALPRVTGDIENEEKEIPKERNNGQEEPCYDISSTFFGATGQLAIRLSTSIPHVNIEVCRDGETIMGLSDLNKAKGSYEWINLGCLGCGDYDIFVTVDDCIIHYVSITI